MMDKAPTGTTSGTPQVLLAHHLQQNLLPDPSVLQGDARVAVRCLSVESALEPLAQKPPIPFGVPLPVGPS